MWSRISEWRLFYCCLAKLSKDSLGVIIIGFVVVVYLKEDLNSKCKMDWILVFLLYDERPTILVPHNKDVFMCVEVLRRIDLWCQLLIVVSHWSLNEYESTQTPRSD